MTDFLFAEPDFFSGLARILDIGGTFDSYNESASPEEADSLAIKNDWITVGQDLRTAMSRREK